MERISRRRALVVDDVAGNRSSLGRLLDWIGVDVTLAVSGAEAIAVYERDPSFDIVVLGSMSSGMDGVTVAKLIRQFQVAKRPYIVGVGSSPEYSAKAIKAGMDTFWVHPRVAREIRGGEAKPNVVPFTRRI